MPKWACVESDMSADTWRPSRAGGSGPRRRNGGNCSSSRSRRSVRTRRSGASPGQGGFQDDNIGTTAEGRGTFRCAASGTSSFQWIPPASRQSTIGCDTPFQQRQGHDPIGPRSLPSLYRKARKPAWYELKLGGRPVKASTAGMVFLSNILGDACGRFIGFGPPLLSACPLLESGCRNGPPNGAKPTLLSMPMPRGSTDRGKRLYGEDCMPCAGLLINHGILSLLERYAV